MNAWITGFVRRNPNGATGMKTAQSANHVSIRLTAIFVLAQAREIWENYPVAGIYFDMVDYHVAGKWSCPFCQELYKNEFGRKFTGTEWMNCEERARYRDWCEHQVAVMLRKLNQLRTEVAPYSMLEHNFHAVVSSQFSHGWKDTREHTDSFMADIFAFRDGSVVDLYYPKIYRNAGSRRKSFILLDTSCAGMVDGYDVSTPRPFDFYQAQTASVLANNLSYCSSICIQIDGIMDETQAEVIRRTNSFFKTRVPYYKNSEPVHYAAIIFPGRSRDIADEANSWRYPAEFTGWVRMLAENQILFDVIADELLGPQSLDPYKLVILPNPEALSDEQTAEVERFADRGGMLVATANTSMKRWDGSERDNFGLASTMGVSMDKPLQQGPTYIHLLDESVRDPDTTVSPWIYLPDGQAQVRVMTDAQTLASLALKPRTSLAFLRFESEYPAITRKNNVVYFAGEPGLAYTRYQYPAIPRLVSRIVQPHVWREMPVRVTGSNAVQVEATVRKNPNQLILHLINRNGNPAWTTMFFRDGRRTFTTGQPHTIPPIYDIKISIGRTFMKTVKTVYHAPDKTDIPFEENATDITFILRKIDLYDIIVVE